MKFLKIWLLIGFFAVLNNSLFSMGQLSKAFQRSGLELPKYRQVPSYNRYYASEEERPLVPYKAAETRNPKDGQKATRQNYGLAGLAAGSAGTYGLMELYQRYQNAEAQKHEEALKNEENQQQELKTAFFNELENNREYAPAFDFSYLRAQYKDYALESYKNKIISEGKDIAKYIPETNFTDVLLLAKDSLKKRYALWEALLERRSIYKILISPEQLAQKLAQVEHSWFDSGLSVEAFLNTQKETKEEQQRMTQKYKMYKPSWTSPKFTEVEKVLPESTKNLIENYEDYINTWKTEGQRELELLRIKKYYKPKVIQRPIALPAEFSYELTPEEPLFAE